MTKLSRLIAVTDSMLCHACFAGLGPLCVSVLGAVNIWRFHPALDQAGRPLCFDSSVHRFWPREVPISKTKQGRALLQVRVSPPKHRVFAVLTRAGAGAPAMAVSDLSDSEAVLRHRGGPWPPKRTRLRFGNSVAFHGLFLQRFPSKRLIGCKLSLTPLLQNTHSSRNGHCTRSARRATGKA